MMNFQITAPIGPFCRDNGVGRTKVYELIADGEIDSVTIGRKRYIIVQSYADFLRRQAQSAPAFASPNPRAGSRITLQSSVGSLPPPKARSAEEEAIVRPEAHAVRQKARERR
jgi:hypothetical protein